MYQLHCTILKSVFYIWKDGLIPCIKHELRKREQNAQFISIINTQSTTYTQLFFPPVGAKEHFLLFGGMELGVQMSWGWDECESQKERSGHFDNENRVKKLSTNTKKGNQILSPTFTWILQGISIFKCGKEYKAINGKEYAF